MKICTLCKLPKELDEFNKRKASKDGHQSPCRSCKNIYDRKYRSINKDAIALHRQEYLKTEAGKKSKINSSRKNYDKYPNSRIARNRTRNAIRSGNIIRPDNCSSCGVDCKPEAHHDCYSKPLDVRFLCRSCHIEWHNQNTPTNR